MVRKGFTLIEALFALVIMSFSIVLCTSMFPALKTMMTFRYPIEEEIALRQLRRTLLLSEDIVVYPNELSFWYKDDWFSLIQDGSRLVRVEGYLIYMDEIDNVEFVETKGCVYLRYERNEKKKERLLVC